MTTTRSSLIPLNITPGVQPSTDKSNFATVHYTAADKIRFRFGYPQKIGGWVAVLIANSQVILGYARSIYSSIVNGAISTVIGTNSKLYSLYGSVLVNITPLNTTTVTAANSLATDYRALGADPIATVNGSNIVTITDTNYANYQVGDTFTLSGATAFNGLTLGQLNTQHVIHAMVTGGYNTIIGGTANATSSGGGAAVNLATGLITLTSALHGQQNGQRVKITGAANVGGIVAATFINLEFIIRNCLTNTFAFMTGGTATSSVSGGGGASTAYQTEIAAGAINQSIGQGYGMGLYGVGLYGTALLSSSALSYPRIWYMDRFGDNVIATAGNQTGLYNWNGSDSTAPTLVTNAPTAINYAFVSNNIIVTFGAGGVPNRIFACDQYNKTQWTGSSSNQVYDYTEVKAGQFKSHVSVAGVNLIFTDYQTYLFSYLGFTVGVANAIWSIQLLENNIGIIGSMARVAVDGVAYWQGQHNFYMWAGGDVTIIPANTQGQSTILNYVYSDINRGQAAKFFAWYNEKFDEIWFHYCSANSNEPDRVARWNKTERHWTPDTADRLAAEYPNQILGYPRLIDSTSVLYEHEKGFDANGQPMAFTLSSNLQGMDSSRNGGRILTDDNGMLTGIVPDSLQTGNISVEVIGQRFPQSTSKMFDNTYTIAPDTEQVAVQGGARLWKYVISGAVLGQQWVAGQWHQYVQGGSKQ